MELSTHYHITQKTARYSTYGELTAATKYFWFALHGSKMLCEQMIYKFSDFDPTEHFVVAPEAMHRFYEKDFGGPVVASWMTKRDRLTEIEDNGNYLSSLYEHFTHQLPKSCVRSILAFSQGGTIAFRWLDKKKVDFDYFIPYACWVPEDIDLTQSKTDLSQSKILFTYGQQDQFLNDKRMAMIQSILEKNNLAATLLPYAGDHRISKQQLKSLFDHYIRT